MNSEIGYSCRTRYQRVNQQRAVLLWQLRIKIARAKDASGDVVPSTSDGSTNLGMSAAGAGPIQLLVNSTSREEADELSVTGGGKYRANRGQH